LQPYPTVAEIHALEFAHLQDRAAEVQINWSSRAATSSVGVWFALIEGDPCVTDGLLSHISAGIDTVYSYWLTGFDCFAVANGQH